jgi:hypothetical protein
MASSSLSYRTSATATAVSFDEIVIMSWIFCCYCVVIVVGGSGVVIFSVVCCGCCNFFVCFVVCFCATLVEGFCAKMYIFLATLYIGSVALLYINIGFLLTRLNESFPLV